MPRLTHDPRTGRKIDPDDDYDYVNDPEAHDPHRLEPNDLQSIHEWQMAENAAGRPAYLTKWQNQNKKKWWNPPRDEHEVLIEAARARNGWQEIIENKLTNRDLYHGWRDQTPTPWDGTISQSTDWGNIITVTRIGIQWLNLRPEDLGKGVRETKTISGIMYGYDWELRRMRVPGMETRPWVWHDKKERRDRFPDDAEIVQQTIGTNDDDIPF